MFSHQKQLHGRSLLPAKASRKPGQRSRAKGRVPSCLINLGWKKNKICLAQDTEASSAACSVYNQESLDIEISSRRKELCQLLQKESVPGSESHSRRKKPHTSSRGVKRQPYLFDSGDHPGHQHDAGSLWRIMHVSGEEQRRKMRSVLVRKEKSRGRQGQLLSLCSGLSSSPKRPAQGEKPAHTWESRGYK